MPHSGHVGSALFMTAEYDFNARQKPDLNWHRTERQGRGRVSSESSTTGGGEPNTLLGVCFRVLIVETTASV